MQAETVNIREKFDSISDYWNPRVAGELNGQYVKLVKFKGPFIWHKHDNEDEMFLVVKGSFTMEMRDKNREIKEGEFIIIPKGVEHKPVAENEVEVMLFEPASTLNTGDKRTDRTKDVLERI
jgi:mannose-6-phosphate isomerase-like protein (cupin superfamily)